MSLRALLRRVISPARNLPWLPVLTGPARGMKWVPGSWNNNAWLGTAEGSKARLFQREIRPGAVVFDIGAHRGYYSLIAAKAAGPRGRIFAFEPDRQNLGFLRTHCALNALTSVTIFDGAVGEEDQKARFHRGESSTTGRLNSDGTEIVECISLDSYAAAKGLAPSVIKIDVEGGELAVLRGAKRLLQANRIKLFLAVHSDQLKADCDQLLRGIGYQPELSAIGGDPHEILYAPVSPAPKPGP